jgi:DNA topoisomerase I
VKLVIVESPAKARTIEKFLGPEYRVEASYGHIRDLPGSAAELPASLKGKPWGRLAVDVEDDFTPHYVVPRESRKRVAELKKLAAKAEEVLLATDEDREGESISWHLQVVLQPRVPVRRVAFHEITRPAIQEAFRQPREVDDQRVRAQETRRILDRLFGYSLSPVLWKKVRTKLSAGRVQSVALRLVVEREEERQRFQSSEYWDVAARLASGDADFTARLVAIGDQRIATGKDFDATTGLPDPASKARVVGQAEAEEIARRCREKLPWRVSSVERRSTRQRPAPPFTTSTLQQAASTRLRMSPKQTMRFAQRLYEGVDLGDGEREGLITYMRTDSVTLSDKALSDAAAMVRSTWGDRYHQTRRYQTKAKSAQEAHEAIRPTEPRRRPEDVARHLSAEELALYELIWRRTLASQMADAEVDQTTLEITAEATAPPCAFRARGSVLRFPGFLAALGNGREDVLLPPLEEGQLVGRPEDAARLMEISAESHTTRPPARYTEASLVKRLEEEGIGRPSTYTPTISTIQERDYVVKKGGYLVPTYVGMAVTRLLRDHFEQYVDLEFTARMEEALDEIAGGKRDWVSFLSDFYRGSGPGGEGLERRIAEQLPRIEYPAIPVGSDPETGEEITVRIGRSSVYVQRGEGGEGSRATLPADVLVDELTPERVIELLATKSRGEQPLGTDPATGEKVYLRSGPYGPYVQLGEGEAGRKPKRTSLPRELPAEEVDLDAALRLLSLPRVLGTDPASGAQVTAGLGRFGPYVERAATYRNLPSFERIFAISLDEAIELLDKKPGGKNVLAELGEHPESGSLVRIVSGRFGPYATDGSLNASLPRGSDPQRFTLEEAVALLAERGKPPGSGRRGRAGKGAGTGGTKAAQKTAQRPRKAAAGSKEKGRSKPGAAAVEKRSAGGSRGKGKGARGSGRTPS